MPPPGWIVDWLDDGALRLRRARWSERWGLIAHGLLTTVGLAWWIGHRLLISSAKANVPALVVGMALLAAAAVALLSIRNELRVGPNRLERRLRIGVWTRVKAIRDGSLRLRSYRIPGGVHRVRAQTEWRLVAHGAGGSIELGRTLSPWDASALPEIAGPLAEALECPELAELGGWLAGVTGWPLQRR